MTPVTVGAKCVVCLRPRDGVVLCRPCDRSLRNANYSIAEIIEWAAKRARRFAVKKMREQGGDWGAFTPFIYRVGPPTKDGHPRHPLYLRGDLKLESHR